MTWRSPGLRLSHRQGIVKAIARKGSGLQPLSHHRAFPAPCHFRFPWTLLPASDIVARDEPAQISRAVLVCKAPGSSVPIAFDHLPARRKLGAVLPPFQKEQKTRQFPHVWGYGSPSLLVALDRPGRDAEQRGQLTLALAQGLANALQLFRLCHTH